MLAARLDAFDDAPGERRVGIDAGELRVDRFEIRHHAAGERTMQRPRRAEDRVTFGHWADCHPVERRLKPPRYECTEPSAGRKSTSGTAPGRLGGTRA